MTSLLTLNQKEAEEKLIDFIIDKKENGMNWGSLHNYLSAVTRLYSINDIVLNRKKINRFMPEQTKVNKDRAYTLKEISDILELADERTRAVVLLFSTSGIRSGVIPKLKVADMEDKGNIYKITIYPNTRHEYYTYCTPECKKAIKSYFEIRERHGDVITGKSPVIREQYNKRGLARYPRFTTKQAVIRMLDNLLDSIGIRPVIHDKNARHSVMYPLIFLRKLLFFLFDFFYF